MSSFLAGVPPTGQMEEDSSAEAPESAEIVTLRDAAKAAPDDVGSWRALATALILDLQHAQDPSQKEIFDLIEALAQILRLNPQDKDALLNMAEVSFGQQVFDKAADYYKRYLDLAPTDSPARARYASTLTYLGKFKEAQGELESILAKDPENFPALSYLAVTLAKMGEKDKALSVGEHAVRIAPEGEARAGMIEFLGKVRGGEVSAAPTGRADRGEAPPPVSSGATFVEQLQNRMRQVRIAGPKLVRVEDAGNGEYKAFFKEFPMQQMPPFAKQKFLSEIGQFLQEDKSGAAKKILLVDVDTAEVMEQVARP